MADSIPPPVGEKLGHDVDLYVDPRTDEAFYVGKSAASYFRLLRSWPGGGAASILRGKPVGSGTPGGSD